MINKMELFVRLIIPDTTSITAFHALERMGYKRLKKLQRQEYYKFYFIGDIEKFKNEITKVDILVNSNKNRFFTKPNGRLSEEKEAVHILVKDIGDKCEKLLHILRERLGFKQIKKMEKGVLWTLNLKGVNKEIVAEEIAKRLLVNVNYQEYKII